MKLAQKVGDKIEPLLLEHFSGGQDTPALSERYDTPLVNVVPFADPKPKRRVAVAWRKEMTRPTAVRKVIEAVRSLDLPVELLGSAQ